MVNMAECFINIAILPDLLINGRIITDTRLGATQAKSHFTITVEGNRQEKATEDNESI